MFQNEMIASACN